MVQNSAPIAPLKKDKNILKALELTWCCIYYMKWLSGFCVHQQYHPIHIIYLPRIPKPFASRALDPCQRSNVPYQHLWPQCELTLQGMVAIRNDGPKWSNCLKFLRGGPFSLFVCNIFKRKKKSGVRYLVDLCWPINQQYLTNLCKSSLSNVKTLPSGSICASHLGKDPEKTLRICVWRMPPKSSDSQRHEITLSILYII